MLNSMTNVLIIEEKKTDVQKRQPCKDKAQIGVMQSQTKEELQTTREVLMKQRSCEQTQE